VKPSLVYQHRIARHNMVLGALLCATLATTCSCHKIVYEASKTTLFQVRTTLI